MGLVLFMFKRRKPQVSSTILKNMADRHWVIVIAAIDVAQIYGLDEEAMKAEVHKNGEQIK